MAYMLTVDQGPGVDSSPSASNLGNANSEGCIMIAVSVFVKRDNASEPEPTVPVDGASTFSAPLPKSCAAAAVWWGEANTPPSHRTRQRGHAPSDTQGG